MGVRTIAVGSRVAEGVAAPPDKSPPKNNYYKIITKIITSSLHLLYEQSDAKYASADTKNSHPQP